MIKSGPRKVNKVLNAKGKTLGTHSFVENTNLKKKNQRWSRLKESINTNFFLHLKKEANRLFAVRILESHKSENLA